MPSRCLATKIKIAENFAVFPTKRAVGVVVKVKQGIRNPHE